jgi:predicted GNAT family acetyltransferase
MAHTFAAPHTPSARFELDIDGHKAFANYRNLNGVIAITHTEVPRELRERGVGSRLVLEMLEQIRAQNLKARPLCSFARFVIAQHPEYRDLVAP